MALGLGLVRDLHRVTRCIGRREQIAGFDFTVAGIGESINPTGQCYFLATFQNAFLMQTDSGMDAVGALTMPATRLS